MVDMLGFRNAHSPLSGINTLYVNPSKMENTAGKKTCGPAVKKY